MAGKLKKARPTIGRASAIRGRDAMSLSVLSDQDAAVLKLAGNPSHINPREDRLLAERMPQAHGEVITRGLLAEAGRRGDDRVTRLTPEEAALLRRSGGSGTRNPASGLLEYSGGGDDDGNSGNTSNAGENTGGMSGAPGSGVAGPEGPGTGRGDGPGPDGIGDDYSGPYGDYSGRSRSGVSYGRFNHPPVESLLAAPSFKQPGISFTQYDPRDTWGRVFQEYFNPSVKAPGRFGAPNAHGPGIMGTAVAKLAGGPFSAAMGWGGAMGRASSKETQEANAREDAARSAHNSTGSQQSHSVLDMDAKIAELRGSEAAGSASGANATATPPPGFTVNPAGQIVPMVGMQQGDNRAAWKDPVENLLHDYIWRGPSGRGW